MTGPFAVAIAAVVVSLLTVLAAVWGRLVQHGESKQSLDATRDANELKRYETLQRDVDQARTANEDLRRENGVLRGRIVALEAAEAERDQRELTMGRRLQALTDEIERLQRVTGGNTP